MAVSILRRVGDGSARKARTFVALTREGGLEAALEESWQSLSRSVLYWSGRSPSTDPLFPALVPPEETRPGSLSRREAPGADVATVAAPPFGARVPLDEAPATALAVAVLVTPGFGGPLSDTLASLDAQTHKPVAVIDFSGSGTVGATTIAPEPGGTGAAAAIVLVSCGDQLHPHALALLGAALEADESADVAYCDEESVVTGGGTLPFLKPEWSPEFLLAMPYVLHPLAIRRDLFYRLAGVHPVAHLAGDYDLALRATAAARGVVHVPRVLCRRPAEPDGPYRAQFGQSRLQAVQRAAAQLDPPASAAPGLVPGTFKLFREDQRPPVSLVIISGDPQSDVEGRGRIRVLANFLRSIQTGTAYPDYRILVADDGELSEETLAAMAACGARRHTCEGAADGSFNFSRKVNEALAQVETDHFVLLNDDLEALDSGWLAALMDYAVDPQIGAVGAHLFLADGTLQHAGQVSGPSGPTHRLYGRPVDAEDGQGPVQVVRDFSGVTAAVLASRRDVLERVGGLDEAFPHDFNDVDFCLRVRAAGYRIVCTPFSRLYHFEHASLRRSAPRTEDFTLFHERWGHWNGHDPYYQMP